MKEKAKKYWKPLVIVPVLVVSIGYNAWIFFNQRLGQVFQNGVTACLTSVANEVTTNGKIELNNKDKDGKVTVMTLVKKEK